MKAHRQHTITKSDLAALRRRLPSTYRQSAVERLQELHGRKVSPSYVSQVAHGARADHQLLESLIALAEEHQTELAELRARLRGKR